MSDDLYSYSYFISLQDYFADTIQSAVKEFNLHIGRSHSFELVAAFFGFNTYSALRADSLLSKDKYQNEPNINLEKLIERATRLQISNEVIEIVQDRLLALHYDEQDHFISLTKRLARNVKHNSYLNNTSLGPIFDSSVFLDEEDWQNCGDIASSDDFVDYQFAMTPWPTIASIVSIHNNPVDGFYQINPDAVLNIIAFLDPNEIDRILDEMGNK